MQGFFNSRKAKILHNGAWFDENGEFHTQRTYIVYGSPGSGKTTYVRNHKLDGDLIVDLDLIKQSISMCNKSNAPDNLLNVATAVRETIYQMIIDNKVDCKNIWVIAGLPDKKERNELANQLNAELIFVDVPYRECLRRVDTDDERTDKIKQKYFIDQWHSKYKA